MSIKALKKIILCKAEVTQGVDAVPVVGSDALLALNANVTPANIRYIDRNAAVPFFGNSGQINVGETMQLEYDIEIAGAGAVDSAPGYAAALLGCATAETIIPTTGPVTYNVVSDSEKSVTQYFYWEDQLHKMLGAFGSVELRFSEANVPLMHFTWEGIYGGITTSAPGSPDLSAFQDALAMTKANTTFTLHGYAAPLASLTISQNNTNVYKNRPNSEKMHYTGRSSTGSVTIELPKIAVKNFVEICRSGTTGALALVHGTTAGNKVLIDAPNVQLTNPRYSEADNLAELTMDMNFKYSTAGNDEWTFKTQ
ncbi:hypothetical protein SAMN05216302_102113 [Nitrosomonas aestuarii]|uniref:Phage tail tube protein n=1 Tax=Nitrosomonas aestuarii TaxID=52441 RepID=A0A1I4DFU7_9PROT|nr:phage tail tube protein [Nitrosomonas aestuarii]SFK92075.1 hypothetical protein SAMN05216302_102113 [Nitrosomonas aestuarii]